jgi:hypothetical protein
MRLNADLITSLFTLALGGLVYFTTRDLSSFGVVFVNYVLAAMVVLSVVVLIKSFIRPEMVQFFESTIERNNVVTGVAILLGYLIFLPLAGFLPSSYLFYFVFNTYLNDHNRLSVVNLGQSLVISAVVVTAFYFIFHNFLGVPLPEGIWFEE